MNSKFFIGGLIALLLAACSEEPSWNNAPPPSSGNGEQGEVIGEAEMWVTTGSKNKLFAGQDPIDIIAGSETDKPSLQVNFSNTFQEIEGYGAALTGSSAYLINKQLSSSKKDELLKKLFDPEVGIGISYLRLTIGASDFSLSDYTYNDLPEGETDPDMSEFSIDRDKENIIPVLKEILSINPDINIMGSPWSAPAWMKTNGALGGGKLKPEWYGAFALYLVKYIMAYASEGIEIDAITIQNEPLHETAGYPTMKMEAEEQADFIKNHLGPLFESEGVNAKIIIYDHNFDRADYPISILDDAAAKAYVAGSAFHAYAGNVSSMSQVHTAHPDKGLYFTEISGGEWATDFSSNIQWYMSNIFIGTAVNWSKNALLWNLALNDEFGPTNGGCQDCRGVVTISDNNAQFNEEYYALAQMGKHVRPGAVRVSSKGVTGNSNIENVAFLNTDGTKVLVLLNKNTSSNQFTVIDGDQRFAVDMDASSVATIVWE